MSDKPKRRRVRVNLESSRRSTDTKQEQKQSQWSNTVSQSPRMSLEQLRGNQATQVSPRVEWYRGYRGFGNADVVVKEIARCVENKQLTDIVTGIRIEKKPRGEFYFFLSLETDYFGYFPDEIDSRLKEDCRHLIAPIEEPYKLEDIEKMASGELKIKNFGQTIPYRKFRLEVSRDPFERILEDEEIQDHLTSKDVDRLLVFLSVQGSGNRGMFHKACEALRLGEMQKQKSLLRNLRLLGHVEMDAKGERWSVNHPSLVQVDQPNQMKLTYWLGARTSDLQGENQSQRNAPSRYIVDKYDERFGTPVCNPALEVVKVAPTIQTYLQGLSSVGGFSEGRDKFRKFMGTGAEFEDCDFQGEEGMYEHVSHSGLSTTRFYFEEKWLQGEWYALRYLHYFINEVLLPCRYDVENWRLAIPKEQRPPLFYERILVLASGLVPTYSGDWLVYHNIPPTLAEGLLEKLAMQYEDATLRELED